jgi:competence protein ComGC
MAISIICNVIDGQLFKDMQIFSSLPQFILTPLMLIFMTKVYHELVAIKGPGGTEEPSKSQKILVIIAGILAVIFIIGMLAIVPALSNARSKARDANRVADISMIKTQAELYLNEYNNYPEKLDDLNKLDASNNINSTGSDAIRIKVPSDPDTTKTYNYKKTERGYELCFELEAKNEIHGYQQGKNCITN